MTLFGREDIRKTAYQKYQHDWMFSHGIGIAEIDAVTRCWMNDNAYLDDPVEFMDYLEGTGFSGELWVSYDEFLEAEFLDTGYMKRLLTEEEYLDYCAECGHTDPKKTEGSEINGLIQRVEALLQDTPDGVIIDADTILADYMDEVDFQSSGFAQDIFRIWKGSRDKKAVEQMFFEFTDRDFKEFLEEAVKKMEEQASLRSKEENEGC